MTIEEFMELYHMIHSTKTVVINGIKASRSDREWLLYHATNGIAKVNGFVVGGIACIETA